MRPAPPPLRLLGVRLDACGAGLATGVERPGGAMFEPGVIAEHGLAAPRERVAGGVFGEVLVCLRRIARRRPPARSWRSCSG